MSTTENTTVPTYKQDWQRRFGTTVTDGQNKVVVVQDAADTMRHLYVSGMNEANRQTEFVTTLILQHLLAGHSAFLFEAHPLVREQLSRQELLLEELNLTVAKFDIPNNEVLADFLANILPTLVEETLSNTVVVSITVAPELLLLQAQALFNTFWQLYYANKAAPLEKLEDLKPTVCVLSPLDQFLTPDGEMEDILAEARVRNLAMILNQDNPAQMTKECVERLLGNTASIVSFRQVASPNLDFLALFIAANLWREEAALTELGLPNNFANEDELGSVVRKLLEQLPPSQAFGQILFKNSHQAVVLLKPDTLS